MAVAGSPPPAGPPKPADQQTQTQAPETPRAKAGYILPEKKSISDIKSKLLAPALTSHYQCWFNPPGKIDLKNPRQSSGFRSWLKEFKNFPYDDEFLSLSCTEAVLPGSSMMTNEINDDFTGVTERHAYRRQFDDRADFTFYVDKDRYYIIRFFEYWLSYMTGESIASGLEDKEYFYRVSYPEDYQSPALYVVKFEKDYAGKYLQYRLLQAYPISISSMPVSYDSSQLLKCTISFTYTRYILDAFDFPILKINPTDKNKNPADPKQQPQQPGPPQQGQGPETPAQAQSPRSLPAPLYSRSDRYAGLDRPNAPR